MPLEGLDRVLDVAATNARAVDRDARFPKETIGALAETGLLGLTIPEPVDAIGGFLSDLARRMGEADAAAPVLSAKAAANEMAIRVTSEVMQACGGAALSPELPMERSFRDARAGSVMAPTTDVLYDLVGKTLAGMPLL